MSKAAQAPFPEQFLHNLCGMPPGSNCSLDASYFESSSITEVEIAANRRTPPGLLLAVGTQTQKVVLESLRTSTAESPRSSRQGGPERLRASTAEKPRESQDLDCRVSPKLYADQQEGHNSPKDLSWEVQISPQDQFAQVGSQAEYWSQSCIPGQTSFAPPL